MAKRSYRQYCFLAHALDLVGERWTLLVVRELLVGPKRFKDLIDGLPGIGTNLLSARLRELEAAGIVRRATLPPPAGSSVYELTDYGQGLKPVLADLVRWGATSPKSPRGEIFRSEWGVLAFRVMFRPGAAAGIKETYEFRIEGEVFHVRIDDGTVETFQGPATEPDLVVTTDPATFIAMSSGRLSAPQAVSGGRMSIEGDPDALPRFLTIFAPERAELATSA